MASVLVRLTVYPSGRERIVYPGLTEEECAVLSELLYWDSVDMLIEADRG